jgi:tetratricopeptide (TPR) repeat protein
VPYTFVDQNQTRAEARRETVAHELAHQWWGNRVGWSSYRDQWLSEALADFSANLFMAHEAERAAVYLAGHARSWRQALARTTPSGRTFESIGPVVLGNRLSGGAYQAVVYDKGSVVFHMLSKALGPDAFAAMLRELANVVANRTISTETFLAAIERMSGLELDGFAAQYIYGTGVPEVHYTYRFVRQDDATWTVEGEARKVAPVLVRHRATRTANGWDVRREGAPRLDVGKFAMIVPFQLSLSGVSTTAEPSSPWKSKTTTAKGLGGTLILDAEVTPFRIPLDREPESFWLDQRGEVLATFHCEEREPKSVLRYRADLLARTGQHDEADELYGRALAAPVLSEAATTDDAPGKRAMERERRLQDATIQVGRAALYLDTERDADAAAALDSADDLVPELDRHLLMHERTVLRTRLYLRAGEFERAYDTLSPVLFLDLPRGDSLADAARRDRFRSRGHVRLGPDAYAILAIAAHETGHREVAATARKTADDLGADMTALPGAP